MLCEQARNCPANAIASARDYRNLTLEKSHRGLSVIAARREREPLLQFGPIGRTSNSYMGRSVDPS